MAPEQAAGKPVDRRADIWSFGLVLHEMLNGPRPPPPVRLRVQKRRSWSASFRSVSNEPELRYQHAADLRADSSAETWIDRRRRRLRPRAGANTLATRRAAAVLTLPYSWAFFSRAVGRDAHRQGHNRPRRVHQYDRRPGIRRDAAPGPRSPAPAVAVPEPRLRRTIRRTLPLMNSRRMRD